MPAKIVIVLAFFHGWPGAEVGAADDPLVLAETRSVQDSPPECTVDHHGKAPGQEHPCLYGIADHTTSVDSVFFLQMALRDDGNASAKQETAAMNEDKCHGLFTKFRVVDFRQSSLARQMFDPAAYQQPRRSSYPASWWSNMDADAKDNPTIAKMFRADQDRLDWDHDGELGMKLRRRILRLLGSGNCRSPQDYYYSAFILHHGSHAKHYRMANVLSLAAVELCDTTRRDSRLCARTPSAARTPSGSARWLFAAAKDRLLVSLGRPQLFGTQLEGVEGIYGNDIDEMTKGQCKWFATGIDARVTDDMRCQWGCPVLARLNLC